MDLKATFLDDERVSIELSNELSTISDSALASDIIINKKLITTDAVVRDSEILHVGGLIDNKVSVVEEITPFFGEIPLIGKAFNSEYSSTSTSRLDVFLKIDIVK